MLKELPQTRGKYQQRCRKFLQLVAMFNNNLRVQVTKNCGLCVRVCVSVCVCVCPRHGAIVARRRSLEAYPESRLLIVPVDVPIDQKPTRAKTRTATSGHASSLHATPRENRRVPVTCGKGQSAGFERDWTKTHHGAGIASAGRSRKAGPLNRKYLQALATLQSFAQARAP